MSAMSEDVGVRRRIEAGQVLGPHLVLAAMIDGSPPIWPVGMSHVATTPESGRQAVRDMKAEGFDLIKVYSMLDYATFQAVADEAHKLHLKVVGHIPGRNQAQTERWLTDGLDMVAHAEEFAYQTRTIAEAEARIPAYVAMAKAHGVGLEATLTTNQRILEQMRAPQTLNSRPELDYVHPLTRAFWATSGLYSNAPPARVQYNAEVAAFTAHLAKAFADAGVPVFVGTDTTVPGLAAGAALQDEIETLAAAGLPARTILESATRGASAWLGVGADRGTVEAGKRADLLLLSGDPLASVSNVRKVAGVVVGGRYMSRLELDQRMTALRARYRLQAAAKPAAPAK
jgi:imidazolonepropionase-like amidohydrolase